MYFVVCKCFQFGQGKIFVVWELVNQLSAYLLNFETSQKFVVWESVYHCFCKAFNSIPIYSFLYNKILDWSKLKAFTDDKINLTEKLKFVSGRVEKIVGKEENAGYQHFLLFQ